VDELKYGPNGRVRGAKAKGDERESLVQADWASCGIRAFDAFVEYSIFTLN